MFSLLYNVLNIILIIANVPNIKNRLNQKNRLIGSSFHLFYPKMWFYGQPCKISNYFTITYKMWKKVYFVV